MVIQFDKLTVKAQEAIQTAQRMLSAKPMTERAVVLMSGGQTCDYPSAEELFEQVELLRKPFTSDELSTCLRRYLVKPSDPAHARF